MAKIENETRSVEEALAFEMIELACDDLGTLARAFDVIEKVCDELRVDLSDVKLPAPERETEIH